MLLAKVSILELVILIIIGAIFVGLMLAMIIRKAYERKHPKKKDEEEE